MVAGIPSGLTFSRVLWFWYVPRKAWVAIGVAAWVLLVVVTWALVSRHLEGSRPDTYALAASVAADRDVQSVAATLRACENEGTGDPECVAERLSEAAAKSPLVAQQAYDVARRVSPWMLTACSEALRTAGKEAASSDLDGLLLLSYPTCQQAFLVGGLEGQALDGRLDRQALADTLIWCSGQPNSAARLWCGAAVGRALLLVEQADLQATRKALGIADQAPSPQPPAPPTASQSAPLPSTSATGTSPPVPPGLSAAETASLLAALANATSPTGEGWQGVVAAAMPSGFLWFPESGAVQGQGADVPGAYLCQAPSGVVMSGSEPCLSEGGVPAAASAESPTSCWSGYGASGAGLDDCSGHDLASVLRWCALSNVTDVREGCVLGFLASGWAGTTQVLPWQGLDCADSEAPGCSPAKSLAQDCVDIAEWDLSQVERPFASGYRDFGDGSLAGACRRAVAVVLAARLYATAERADLVNSSVARDVSTALASDCSALAAASDAQSRIDEQFCLGLVGDLLLRRSRGDLPSVALLCETVTIQSRAGCLRAASLLSIVEGAGTANALVSKTQIRNPEAAPAATPAAAPLPGASPVA